MGQAESHEVRCCGITPQKPVTNPNFARRGPIPVPPILEAFLEARRLGNVQAAVDCCSADITMRGPMGEFAGIDVVKTKAFSKPSQPLGKMLMQLQYQPHLSSVHEAVFAREFEAQIGYAQVPLRQEFTVRNPEKANARVCLVVFSKLNL